VHSRSLTRPYTGQAALQKPRVHPVSVQPGPAWTQAEPGPYAAAQSASTVQLPQLVLAVGPRQATAPAVVTKHSQLLSELHQSPPFVAGSQILSAAVQVRTAAMHCWPPDPRIAQTSPATQQSAPQLLHWGFFFFFFFRFASLSVPTPSQEAMPTASAAVPRREITRLIARVKPSNVRSSKAHLLHQPLLT
jgi:hypothetical protein